MFDKDKAKKKIFKRFRDKPSGYLDLKIDNNTKLRIEYMYGALYGLTRLKRKGPKTRLIVMANIDKIIEKIMQEKYGKFKAK